MKRLAIYLDGTWDAPSARTNVYQLFKLTAGSDGHDPQLSFYQEGVGTRLVERLQGGVLGYGAGRNVRAAYSWLMTNYEDGDLVYILGFSRGAYTARSLAGMIERCGLLENDTGVSVSQVYRRYTDQNNRRAVPGARRIEIHFLGVWDTVGALGVPFGRIRGLSRSMTLFHNTNPSTHYRNMFQALAIDENRAAYAPTLWTGFQKIGIPLRPLKEDQRLEQRWFAGAHTDVGGGKHVSGVSRLALKWMAECATECGLVFDGTVNLAGDEVKLGLTDSFSRFLLGIYRLARLNRRFYREIGREPSQTPIGDGISHPLNETIDGSVFDRCREPSLNYRPRNLTAWAQKHGQDLTALHGTIPARPSDPIQFL